MINFKRYGELLEDTLAFIPKIAGVGFDLIVGIPRSGLTPASIIAQQLALPMGVLMGDSVYIEGRFGGKWEEHGKTLFVDDSCYKGATINPLRKLYPKSFFSCIYSEDGEFVDYYQSLLPSPRLFEWNLFHHSVLESTMMDIDGILCLDPCSEDLPQYEDEIREATLLRRPRKVHTLITMRLEKYRSLTSDWLSRRGIEYNNLIMSQFDSPQERRQKLKAEYTHSLDSYGAQKAKHYTASLCDFFIESNDRQAFVIQSDSKKPVYSMSKKYIYQ